eukprot:4259746-Alexandrium_andersonii.AAC.1
MCSRRCWSVPGFFKSAPGLTCLATRLNCQVKANAAGAHLAVDAEGLARHVIDDEIPGAGVAHEAP